MAFGLLLFKNKNEGEEIIERLPGRESFDMWGFYLKIVPCNYLSCIETWNYFESTCQLIQRLDCGRGSGFQYSATVLVVVQELRYCSLMMTSNP